jgi:hypothetical protein
MRIPTSAECARLLEENQTPANVIAHCEGVRDFALSLAKRLSEKGVEVNLPLVSSAAHLHDIEKLKPNHVMAGHDLIRSRGYPEVAVAMKTHGLENLHDPSFYPRTIEEKIIFYADKRVKDTTIVSMDQRFSYIRKKYNSPAIEHEFTFAKKIEDELFALLGEGI